MNRTVWLQQSAGAQLCAFDILVEGDDDLRKILLRLRKTSLQRLLARRATRGRLAVDIKTRLEE
jgi:ATP-dependent DNA ligase